MDVERNLGPETASILSPHRYTSYLTTDRGYLTSNYVLESTFTGPHNYSNHVVAARFFCEYLAPCSGLLNMRSTPRMDARKKVRCYRGKRAGIRQKKQRILNKIWSIESVHGRRVHPTEKRNLHNMVNMENLIRVKSTWDENVSSRKKNAPVEKFCSFGSVCNKYITIKDFVVDNDFDIFAFTETWLNPGDHDKVIIGSLTPKGYRFVHARENRGRGVGLLFKNTLNVKQTSTTCLGGFKSFEAIEVQLQVYSHTVFFLVVYRPPPSIVNNLSTGLFMDEFSSLLQLYVTTPGSLAIAGDFNFHIDDTSDTATVSFLKLLDSFNLRQHVQSPTHRVGHYLDLVISQSQ